MDDADRNFGHTRATVVSPGSLPSPGVAPPAEDMQTRDVHVQLPATWIRSHDSVRIPLRADEQARALSRLSFQRWQLPTLVNTLEPVPQPYWQGVVGNDSSVMPYVGAWDQLSVSGSRSLLLPAEGKHLEIMMFGSRYFGLRWVTRLHDSQQSAEHIACGPSRSSGAFQDVSCRDHRQR